MRRLRRNGARRSRGLLVSLLFTELFGLAAGGMVVPGYIALYMTDPLSVVATPFR